MKDTWTKPQGGRTEVEKWGWLGLGGEVGGKWRQLYSNNNKMRERNMGGKKKKKEHSIKSLVLYHPHL